MKLLTLIFTLCVLFILIDALIDLIPLRKENKDVSLRELIRRVFEYD